MLERNVLIDGTVYHTHRVTRLNAAVGLSTIATVTSTKLADESVKTTRSFSLPYADGMRVEDAEETLWALPEFEEYDDCVESMLDEVLAILTDEQAETVPDAFAAWAVGVSYKVGDRRRYGGRLYKCVQAHVSQAGWEPPSVPALWTPISQGGVPEWVQPTGAHDAYQKGDHVMHVGREWVSTVNANTWEPGVYGWEEA